MTKKHQLYITCLHLVEEKITGINQLIADAQASSNNDTKSSMGDKYETTREMMQIEINKLNKQLHEAQQMLLALKVIDPNKECQTVEAGAVVETDKMMFFIATAIGKVLHADANYMVISPASPLGKTMQGKKAGETATVNGATYAIRRIH